jgi:shikimate kinase
MKLILLGYMGSGKTVVGEHLASMLNFSFLDLDTEIENREKCSISNLFEGRGEIYFRKKETEILSEILKAKISLVLSTGGGTPCYGSNMEILLTSEEVITIYLRLSIRTLTERLFEEKGKRPLIRHIDTREKLQEFVGKHLFERVPVYERSNMVIDTDEMTPQEISAQIIAKLF